MSTIENMVLIAQEKAYDKGFADAVEEMMDKLNDLREENYLLKNTLRNTLSRLKEDANNLRNIGTDPLSKLNGTTPVATR